MANGIRIEPQPDRLDVADNQMIVLRDQSRKRTVIPETPTCDICRVQHDCKTYHFQLVDGAVIVSTTIWERLQAMPDNGGFQVVNVVERPPTQRLAVNVENAPIRHFSPAIQE